MARALVIGHEGQDGTYLARLLRGLGYLVVGIDSQSVDSDVAFISQTVDISSLDAITSLLQSLQPDEIYFLAAFHHASEDPPLADHALVASSFSVNTLALNNVLSAIATRSPDSRLFYASSSRVFGEPLCAPQSEVTPLNPTCAYGISKTAGMRLCRYYRTRNVYASTGILYNHESSLRRAQFLSKKVVRAAVRIWRGSREKLVIGNLNMRVDWGYAPDYVRAMRLILQLKTPQDFVVGTGLLHSTQDLVESVFGKLGLDWKQYVVEDPACLNRRSPQQTALCADATKLRALTGWQPEMSFHDMLRIMIDEEAQNACD